MAGNKLEGLQRRMRAALVRGVEQGQCSRTANTCANILKLWPAVWAFTTNPALEPTNNAAEQALRSLVPKRKISGPTRSLRGDQFLSHGFTVHETRLRQGADLWKFMHEAVTAFIADTTPPSLMPRATCCRTHRLSCAFDRQLGGRLKAAPGQAQAYRASTYPVNT